MGHSCPEKRKSGEQSPEHRESGECHSANTRFVEPDVRGLKLLFEDISEHDSRSWARIEAFDNANDLLGFIHSSRDLHSHAE